MTKHTQKMTYKIVKYGKKWFIIGKKQTSVYPVTLHKKFSSENSAKKYLKNIKKKERK